MKGNWTFRVRGNGSAAAGKLRPIPACAQCFPADRDQTPVPALTVEFSRNLITVNQALLTATADVAGDKVGEARKRLAAALERGRQIASRVKEKAVAGAKATDKAVHEHPYQAIAVGVGVGLLVGYLLARRSTRKGE